MGGFLLCLSSWHTTWHWERLTTGQGQERRAGWWQLTPRADMPRMNDFCCDFTENDPTMRSCQKMPEPCKWPRTILKTGRIIPTPLGVGGMDQCSP